MTSIDLELATRTIAAGIPVGIILVARDGRVTYANREACRILDTTEDELARTSRDCNVASSLARRSDLRTARQETCSHSIQVATPRGSPVYLQVSPTSLADNDTETRTLVTFRDVTRHVRLERQMHAQDAISASLRGDGDLPAVLEVAARQACTIFDASFASISMPYPSGRGLTLAAAYESDGGSFDQPWPSDAVLKEVMCSSAARLIDGPAFPRPDGEEEDTSVGCGYVIPIASKQLAIGVLSIAMPDGHPHHRADDFAAAVDFAATLARSVEFGLKSLEKEHRAKLATRQLEDALECRVVIEQAKGMLAGIHRISVGEAMYRIRGYASRSGRPIHAVAADIVDRRIFV